jgi:hypothetical protein
MVAITIEVTPHNMLAAIDSIRYRLSRRREIQSCKGIAIQ